MIYPQPPVCYQGSKKKPLGILDQKGRRMIKQNSGYWASNLVV